MKNYLVFHQSREPTYLKYSPNKIVRHTRGEWLIRGPKQFKDNHTQSLKHPYRISQLEK